MKIKELQEAMEKKMKEQGGNRNWDLWHELRSQLILHTKKRKLTGVKNLGSSGYKMETRTPSSFMLYGAEEEK